MNRTFAVVSLSLIGGIALALLYASYGVLAIAVLFIAILAATRLDRRGLAIGAQLFGIGATITLLMLPWTINCTGTSASACGASPGGEAFFFIGVAIAASGAFVAAKSAPAS